MPSPRRRGLGKGEKPRLAFLRGLKKLPRSFYLRPTLAVARDLLGKYLIRNIHGKRLVGRIVEVEAYLGEKDPASHAYRGKTTRNEVMFQEGGHLYVYFTYGMHFCSNVVTERQGKGRAVLIRAVEPIEGINIMAQNRNFTRQEHGRRAADETNHRILTNGPAKLCEAFGIEREQNGTDLLGDEIYLTTGDLIRKPEILSTPRVGIRNGAEKRWRFYIKNNIFVSK
ncbi:MAG: DNA-3-methyladenine glycosylase [Ignavibacteria bacterium]|nr:DNA-3-methyladenine glycosylase [Ignavibacteria bacterium]MBI3765851.1 DNA-3-methyladenine glycosylase [Ignavibacteriales bacterium]